MFKGTLGQTRWGQAVRPAKGTSRAKKKYEAAVNELERLMKLRDEEYRKELLKHIAASKRSYDEIIAFLDGNADEQP